MILKKQHVQLGLALLALTGCAEQPDRATSETAQDVQSDDFIKSADQRVKLMALRGPKWSNSDLTYAMSACWRFASGVNISYGKGTCALVAEELELPTYEIDFGSDNPMADCYGAVQDSLMRMSQIDKRISDGDSPLLALATYNTENPMLLESINVSFTSCKKAYPALNKEMNLTHIDNYATQAFSLMPGRRKREAMEALGTAASLIWPDEQVEGRARSEAETKKLDANRKASAELAIEQLK